MTSASRSLDISVIVPTCRRPALMERCLQALLAQTLAPDCFEILVVDDGHDEATRAMVEGHAARHAQPRIRYLRPPSGHGPAVARNCGWRAAQAPVVAFTDDDTQPAADWLQQGLAALVLHRDWVALAGQVKVPRAAAEPAQRPTDHELMTRGQETAELVTANAFVWRDALDKVDGFDERFLRASLQAPGHVLAM